MDTVDKADKVSQETTEVVQKKRGRPAKQEPTTPQGELRKMQAEEYRKKKGENKVVEKWYELRGHKVSLCKRVKTGGVYRTYVGSIEDKQNGKQLKEFVEKQKAAGNLRLKY
jgi:hypothetical protein